MSKGKIKAWMDYDRAFNILHEEVYFKRPTTRHTDPDIHAIEVEITFKKPLPIRTLMGRKNG